MKGCARRIFYLVTILLLQESRDAVRQVAAAQGFEEHHTFSIDPNTDWNAIFRYAVP